MSIDLTPGSPEWTKRITASKVAAVLGVSPWQSPRSLWFEMKGLVERPATNTAQSRGHYLEPAILAWFKDQHGVLDGEFTEQPTYTLGDWAAATPDMVTHVAEYDHENVLVEAKSAAYDDEWGAEGTDQIPAYYLAQTFWQMHISGIHRTYVPIITSRLRFAEYVVDHDPTIGADLEQRMRAFCDSLAGDEPPSLDDSVATFESMRRLHPEIDRGESVELTEMEARRLVEWVDELKSTEASTRLAKSTVLDRMGRAQYATYNGVRIARRQPRGEAVTFVVVGKPSDLTEVENVA